VFELHFVRNVRKRVESNNVADSSNIGQDTSCRFYRFLVDSNKNHAGFAVFFFEFDGDNRKFLCEPHLHKFIQKKNIVRDLNINFCYISNHCQPRSFELWQ